MIITRLYTGLDNECHFEDVEIALNDAGDIGKLLEKLNANGVVFRETGGDILLAEDTTGRGHISRSIDGKLRRSIFITLD